MRLWRQELKLLSATCSNRKVGRRNPPQTPEKKKGERKKIPFVFTRSFSREEKSFPGFPALPPISLLLPSLLSLFSIFPPPPPPLHHSPFPSCRASASAAKRILPPFFFSFSLSHPSVDPIMPPSPLSLSPSSFITQPGGGREDFAVEVKQEGFVGWSLKAPAPLGGCCTCSPPFYSLARSLFLQRLGFLHG